MLKNFSSSFDTLYFHQINEVFTFAFRGPVLQRTARQDTQLRALEGEQRDERRQGKGEKERL